MIRNLKIFTLITLLILTLSGCTIEYNVTISEENATEEIVVNNFTVETFPTPAFIDAQGASETNEEVEGVEYYDISYRNNNTYFNYDFSINDYDRSTAVNTCLASFKRDFDGDGNYIINTSSYYSCFDLYPLIEEIVVNVNLDTSIYKLIDSNADSENNGSLVWTITKDNYQNKSIQIIYDLIEDEDPYQENTPEPETPESEVENWVNDNLILVIVGVFGFLIFIIVLVVVLKKKTSLK